MVRQLLLTDVLLHGGVLPVGVTDVLELLAEVTGALLVLLLLQGGKGVLNVMVEPQLGHDV